MEKITSRANPLLVQMKKLGASAAYRRQQGLYLCDSPKLLAEAVKWNAPIRHLAVTEEQSVKSVLFVASRESGIYHQLCPFMRIA